MTEKRTWTPVENPGREEQCKNCPYRLEDDFTNSGFPCRKVETDNFGSKLSSPEWTYDNKGALSCNGYLHPLSERVHAKIEAASKFLTSLGIQLPQIKI